MKIEKNWKQGQQKALQYQKRNLISLQIITNYSLSENINEKIEKSFTKSKRARFEGQVKKNGQN